MVTEEQGVYELGSYLVSLADTSQAWTIDDVTRAPLVNAFTPSPQRVPAFGYSASAYWLRFTVVWATEEEGRWLLELSNKSLDRVALYVPNATGYVPNATGDYRVFHSGEARAFSGRRVPHRNFVFPLHASPGAAQTIYLRVASQGPMGVPLHLWSSEAFARKDRVAHFFLGLFFGILLIMAGYNFFLFVALWDYSYLYYVLYIVSFILYQLAVERLGFAYLWPESVWWQGRANSTLALFCAIWGIQFSRSFLQTGALMPRLDTILMGLMTVCVPLMGVNVLFGGRAFVNVLVVGFFIVVAIALMAAGGMAWLRGHRAARYYLIAWGFLLVGTLLTMLIYLGVMPYHFWALRGVQIGSVLEVTLLSLGLGHRYNMLRKERERMRLRIASDLHDDIGSGLTQISLYSELARREPGPRADVWLEKIGTQARSLVEKMQDIVWAIRPEQESWEALELRMKDFAIGLLAPRSIAFEMHGEAEDPQQALALEVRQNVLMMFKEVLHNAVRHADCTKVQVRWTLTENDLWLHLYDDGHGFDPNTVHAGHGLKNLRHRAAEIGATLSLETAPGEPTCIAMDVPLRRVWTRGNGVSDRIGAVQRRAHPVIEGRP